MDAVAFPMLPKAHPPKFCRATQKVVVGLGAVRVGVPRA